MVFDLLQEERKYSVSQLVNMAELNSIVPKISKNEWEKTIQQMIQMGLLITEV